MDTYKEKQTLDELYHRGNAPWVVWNKNEHAETPASRVRVRANGRFSKDVQPTNAVHEPLELAAQANP